MGKEETKASTNNGSKIAMKITFDKVTLKLLDYKKDLIETYNRPGVFIEHENSSFILLQFKDDNSILLLDKDSVEAISFDNKEETKKDKPKETKDAQ